MPTILSINFNVPEGWHELSDKQLRYVYQFLADDFATDEVKTVCLLQWSGTKVIGRQDNGSHLLKRGKIIFEVTPLTLLSYCRISTDLFHANRSSHISSKCRLNPIILME